MAALYGGGTAVGNYYGGPAGTITYGASTTNLTSGTAAYTWIVPKYETIQLKTQSALDYGAWTYTIPKVTYAASATTTTWTYDKIINNIDWTNIAWGSINNINSNIVLPRTKAEELRDRIAAQNAPKQGNRMLAAVKAMEPEAKARGLLRELVGDREFGRYLGRGFILVRGQTGLLYKISGKDHAPIVCMARTKDGKYKDFESLCVVFKDYRLPPTDKVIMQKLLVENDEFGMRAMANVTRFCDEAEVDLGAARALLPATRRHVTNPNHPNLGLDLRGISDAVAAPLRVAV